VGEGRSRNGTLRTDGRRSRRKAGSSFLCSINTGRAMTSSLSARTVKSRSASRTTCRKRAACPACKKVLTIPARFPIRPTSRTSPLCLREHQGAERQGTKTSISSAAVRRGAAPQRRAGRQTESVPECKRIIKVPQLAKSDPRIGGRRPAAWPTVPAVPTSRSRRRLGSTTSTAR